MGMVLLVDDDEDDRMLMRMALHSLNASVPMTEFENGSQLLAFLQQTEAAGSAGFIIVLDKFMPILDGFDTLAMLKQHPDFARIPVVLFVNPQDDQDMERCTSLGATACLIKPLHYDEMLGIMQTVYSYWQHSNHPPATGAEPPTP